MTWRTKFFALMLVSLPAFVGYPVVIFDAQIIPGITYGWVAYFMIANTLIIAINGSRFYANVLAVAALISMPVVFIGATIAFLISLLGLGYEAGQAAYSPHYVSVCMTMLTVIPLALSLIGVVPFQRFEHRLLQGSSGVSKLEKCFLMFLRVFNHIVYYVIPNILETIREEGHYRKWSKNETVPSNEPSGAGRSRALKAGFPTLIQEMVQLAVESICASIQFIPLWAVEISQLPGKRRTEGE
jgi:hypothetical protein